VNIQDYQRFVPDAVSAGWMDAPPPPSLRVTLTDPFMVSDSSGFTDVFNFVDLFQNFSDQLGFFVASGEWRFTVT
jgi:hypothetical protein